MKSKIRAAAEAKDITKVRELLIELMSTHAGDTKVLMEISETISTVPGVFDEDDGKPYPAAHEITRNGLRELADDLKKNFSLPKYRLFTEVHARIKRDPDFKIHKEENVATLRADGIVSEQADTETTASPKAGSKVTRIVGYVLMILGVATAVVGICVPVGFMIGLGVGVIMLGLAITYMALPRN